MTQGASEAADRPEIDAFASRSWHFPLNNPKRPYQFDIIQQALRKNTLVALPTGLGKTFIAAVVMFNFYRWFPTGKVLFMAPTRPLVTQQLEATLRTVEIDAKLTTEMTGGQSPAQRHELWQGKRVFFLTPQVLQNDLISGICDCRQLVLLVFDEAHRALGNHAYCNIVRMLRAGGGSAHCRILALTATPASSVDTVQQVIDNLLISDIAIRTEDSLDVRPYTHTRRISSIVVPESEEIRFARQIYENDILKPYIDKLNQLYAISEHDPSKLGSFQLIQARENLRRKGSTSSLPRSTLGAAEGVFAVLISLYHAYDLLAFHGIKAFVHHLTKLPDESAAVKSRMRHELDSNPSFVQLMAHLDTLMRDPQFVSHPKIDIVESTLLQHFAGGGTEDGGSTRAIVFSQFRESVYEIVARMNRHSPLLKVMAFVGQSSASSQKTQITQKQQLEVLEKFRAGGYNVLVATCIAEEGLDIGNVDLIICFDMQSSPIRMLQRMGRTGRHRDGTIVLLQSAGREEQRYQKTISKHSSVQKAISNPADHFTFFHPDLELIPRGIKPLEREFCVDDNLAVLEAAKKAPLRGPKKSTRIDRAAPLPASVLPVHLLTAVETPKTGRHLSWEKIPGATFQVGRSLATERLFYLFRAFEEIENRMLESSEQLYAKGDAEDHGSVHAIELEALMQSAIDEMQRFKSSSRSVKSWSDHCALFDSFMSGRFSQGRDKTPDAPTENPLLLGEDALSDGFFNDEQMSIGSLEGLAPFKSLNLENNSRPRDPVASSAHEELSQLGPLRRPQVGVLNTSSMGPGSATSESPCSPLKRSRFVDIEAGCSETSCLATGNDEDESGATSLDGFIDDRSEVTEYDNTDSNGEQENELSSEGMMAFYRRSAYGSQPDPRFKTMPKQFALRTKLKLETLSESASSTDPDGKGMVAERVDWSSDLEL